MRRSSWIVLAITAVVILAATAAAIRAQGPPRPRACANCPSEPRTPQILPPTVKGPMQQTRIGEALSVLSFDDGTCESGLGGTFLHSSLVEFDVPTQCIQGGLDIVGLTMRENTGTAVAFAWGQAGAAPPTFSAISTLGISAVIGAGPCPASAFVTRPLGPGAALVTGTSNFFAGVRHATTGGFIGRDTNGPNAMRNWLNCPVCAMTQYSPTDITGIGFPGNFLIRVTVEDQNCIPVELMGFDVS